MKIQDEKLAELRLKLSATPLPHSVSWKWIGITLPIYCCPQACVWLSRATGKPIIATQILAAAMMVANQNIIGKEEEEDDKPKCH